MGGKLSSHCLIFLNFIYAVAMDKIVLCKKNLRFFKQESILLDFLCFSFSFFVPSLKRNFPGVPVL